MNANELKGTAENGYRQRDQSGIATRDEINRINECILFEIAAKNYGAMKTTRGAKKFAKGHECCCTLR